MTLPRVKSDLLMCPVSLSASPCVPAPRWGARVGSTGSGAAGGGAAATGTRARASQGAAPRPGVSPVLLLLVAPEVGGRFAWRTRLEHALRAGEVDEGKAAGRLAAWRERGEVQRHHAVRARRVLVEQVRAHLS